MTPLPYSDPKSTIKLKTTNKCFRFVNILEIVYIQAHGNYSWVFLADGSKYMQSCNLGKMGKDIKANIFYRCHRSYIVNVGYVKETCCEAHGKFLLLRTNVKVKLAENKEPGLLTYFQ